MAYVTDSFKNTTGIAACAPYPVGTFSVQNPIYGTVTCTLCIEELSSLFVITSHEGSI